MSSLASNAMEQVLNYLDTIDDLDAHPLADLTNVATVLPAVGINGRLRTLLV